MTQLGPSSLKVQDNTGNSHDQVKWIWNRGAQTMLAEFHDPVHSSATYRVCLYDASGNPQPLLDADVPPGGTCGLKPCWKPTASGFVYKNTPGLPDGVVSLTLKTGVDGRAKIQATAKGTNLQMPALPLTLPVTAQLVIVDGAVTQCWQTTFTAAILNQPSYFRATGP